MLQNSTNVGSNKRPRYQFQSSDGLENCHLEISEIVSILNAKRVGGKKFRKVDDLLPDVNADAIKRKRREALKFIDTWRCVPNAMRPKTAASLLNNSPEILVRFGLYNTAAAAAATLRNSLPLSAANCPEEENDSSSQTFLQQVQEFINNQATETIAETSSNGEEISTTGHQHNVTTSVQLSTEQIGAKAALSKCSLFVDVSLERALKHFVIAENFSLTQVSNLLLFMKRYVKVGTEYLPKTGKTLLKKPASELKKYKIKNITTKQLVVTGARRAAGIPQLRKTIICGQYLHFGLQNALELNSAGILHRWEYIKLLRHVHMLCPNLLPQIILDRIGRQACEEFDTMDWQDVKSSATETLHFEICAHIDGVRLFKVTKRSQQGLPILASIIKIGNSKQSYRVPNPKPFLVGFFIGKHKPPIDKLVGAFLEELVYLRPYTDCGPTSVDEKEITCSMSYMVCDAPARSYCKGSIGHSGYHSCERCTQPGERDEDTNRLVYPKLTSLEPRDGKHWRRYHQELDDNVSYARMYLSLIEQLN